VVWDENLAESLEERVQILETLLKEYYLNDYYLDKVKDFINHHKELDGKLIKNAWKKSMIIVLN
jgi:hypothetical protein